MKTININIIIILLCFWLLLPVISTALLLLSKKLQNNYILKKEVSYKISFFCLVLFCLLSLVLTFLTFQFNLGGRLQKILCSLVSIGIVLFHYYCIDEIKYDINILKFLGCLNIGALSLISFTLSQDIFEIFLSVELFGFCCLFLLEYWETSVLLDKLNLKNLLKDKLCNSIYLKGISFVSLLYIYIKTLIFFLNGLGVS